MAVEAETARVVATRSPIRRIRHILVGLASTPGGAFGLFVVSVLALCTAVGPHLTPADPSAQDVPSRLQGPSSSHLLGTDALGRDLLSRVIVGTRIAIEVGVPAILLALLVGTALGLVAAFAGGWVDSVAIVIMDTLQVFPAVVLALLVLTLLGQSLVNLVVVIAVAFIPNYARVSRALVLTTKEEAYIDAERSLGANAWRIVGRHIMPNVLAPLMILVAMDIPFAIVAEAGLSFLGLGVQPPTPSWGVILSDGFSHVQDSPWDVAAASVALGFTTVGFTLFAERLRAIVDPKTRMRQWRGM
ncbi:MAG: peptide/nickel transport system permease protein [Gaiellales bacterium]|jgi:peptide/nickel transport system permease protein|nr:peptide/nickel transport system permease protein [Gaiellales bacterium]